jgi:hypothetical protein
VSGHVTVNSAPSPSWLWTVTTPPNAGARLSRALEALEDAARVTERGQDIVSRSNVGVGVGLLHAQLQRLDLLGGAPDALPLGT